MADSAFRGTIVFFQDLGVFDVILPFLLVFTIVFAILEKTRVFGSEEIEGKKYTRKNINAMTSFVIAFFVVASSRIVEIITEVSANVVLLLLGSVLFLMLIGSFYKETPEGVFLEEPWKQIFIGIMFLGLTLIFLHAVRTEDGKTWLDVLLESIKDIANSKTVASIVFAIVVIVFMIIIISGGEKRPSPKKST